MNFMTLTQSVLAGLAEAGVLDASLLRNQKIVTRAASAVRKNVRESQVASPNVAGSQWGRHRERLWGVSDFLVLRAPSGNGVYDEEYASDEDSYVVSGSSGVAQHVLAHLQQVHGDAQLTALDGGGIDYAYLRKRIASLQPRIASNGGEAYLRIEYSAPDKQPSMRRDAPPREITRRLYMTALIYRAETCASEEKSMGPRPDKRA